VHGFSSNLFVFFCFFVVVAVVAVVADRLIIAIRRFSANGPYRNTGTTRNSRLSIQCRKLFRI